MTHFLEVSGFPESGMRSLSIQLLRRGELSCCFLDGFLKSPSAALSVPVMKIARGSRLRHPHNIKKLAAGSIKQFPANASAFLHRRTIW
jgi:hypothetical protein